MTISLQCFLCHLSCGPNLNIHLIVNPGIPKYVLIMNTYVKSVNVTFEHHVHNEALLTVAQKFMIP